MNGLLKMWKSLCGTRGCLFDLGRFSANLQISAIYEYFYQVGYEFVAGPIEIAFFCVLYYTKKKSGSPPVLLYDIPSTMST
jgi:hypothetical protein